jgi:predicted unusual protein kinase regulating ubiquinone biosynthesis (AarF/ABC1/UbiB family)
MLVKAKPQPPAPRWQKPRYSGWERQKDVTIAIGRFLSALWWDRLRGQNTSERRSQRAQWLAKTLIDLGPAFIKVGQALSTRPDLLPSEYIVALSRLQDSVPAFSTDLAIATIEAELGQPIQTIFAEFEPEPIAAASLGQVHRAVLHEGDRVVVKIQRPGLEPLFDLDFKVLRQLIHWSELLFPWTQQYDLESIYQEFFRVLYQEIDYVREAHNADHFRKNFQEFHNVRVPKVYWPYTTSRVLVMEYLPGIKVDDCESLDSCGIDTKRLNQLGVCCYLKQLLQDGFFQADPHPGNLAVAPDGSLIFYDFGMFVEVKSLAKDQMLQTLFAVLQKDSESVLESLISMGLIEPVSDMRPVRKLLQFTLERFAERPVDVNAFTEMRREIATLFEQQPFRLPAQMTYILKSITTLDGIARRLDPEYNLIALAKPFVKQLAGIDANGSAVAGSGRNKWLGLAKLAVETVQAQLSKPNPTVLAIQRLEQRIERGELELRVRSTETERALKRLNLTIECLMHIALTGCLFIGGAVLTLGSLAHWAAFVFAAAGVAAVVTVRALIRLSLRKRLDRLMD